MELAEVSRLTEPGLEPNPDDDREKLSLLTVLYHCPRRCYYYYCKHFCCLVFINSCNLE